ncbi:matrix metalloproteinase-23 isoform X3 [Rhinolophus sinicus]|uniref:matrix metalloproteinase-23 isoform X3 n=1 Tax=Rhinolophus sinicus TaxID=89399 RepID=UPI003D7B822D
MKAPLPGLIRCRRVGFHLGRKPLGHSAPASLGTPTDHRCLTRSPWRLSLPWRSWPSSPPQPPPPRLSSPARPAGPAQATATHPQALGPLTDCRMASWFPSGVAAPASRPHPGGCNPSRRGASPSGSSGSSRSRSPRTPSPDSKSAGVMGRGASVPRAASGIHAQAGWLGAVLGALCLLLALVLLARLGAPAARPATSAAQGDTAPHPARVLPTLGPSPLPPHAPRRRRYTLTPARLRWDHFNLTYRILSFPRNLLSPSETRRGLAAAFRMWSDVSPFSFREVAPEQPSDLRIGFYPANHTDCLESALHHCFDGPTGELAHAFFPPHGGIHFDDSEYWVLGPTRYSWKKGAVAGRAVGAAPTLRLPGPAVRVRVLGAEGLLRRPPEAHEEAVPQQLRLLLRVPLSHGGRHRAAPQDQNQAGARGQERDLPLRPEDPAQERQSVVSDPPATARVGGALGTLPSLPPSASRSWYKDQEPLEFSYPGYLALGEAHLSIIANAINEGTYTCVVRRRQRVLSTYSWRVRVRS